MKSRKIYKIRSSWSDVRNKLLSDYSISAEAGRQIAIYLTHDKDVNKEVHLKIRDKKCSIKCVDISNPKKTPIEFIVKHKGLKPLLKLLKEAGYQKGNIGEVATLSYHLNKELVFEVLLGSFLGDIIFVYNEADEKSFSKLFFDLISQGHIEKVDKEDIVTITESLSSKKTEIINDLGVINNRVNQFCLTTGFGIDGDKVTLREEIENFCNNYSSFEDLFQTEFGVELLGNVGIINTSLYKPISIIIPCYQAESTILKTLASIQSQNISKELLAKTEVVLIDDGSTIPVESVLKQYPGKTYTQIKVVRLSNNCGRATARNIGANIAKQKTVLFIDSDILLPSNYLLEISTRNNFISTAIFVALKQNINIDDKKISMENIKAGLPVPNLSLDMRVTKKIGPDTPGINNANSEKYIEILSETDCFKQFGYGRKVGIFDLPAMVVSHNVSMRRKNFFRAGGFSDEFVGWGMEDSYFGARSLAMRNFIIPVLSTGVYHIDHAPRSGSEEKKNKELSINLNKYIKLMNSPLEID